MSSGYNKAMADFSSITILYNPKSTGESRRNALGLEKRLKKTKYADIVNVSPTEHAGHAEEIARDITLKQSHPLIISSSGDGGYNEVVNGVMNAQNDSHKPITGLLPSGNANDHYKQLHKPFLVRQIMSGAYQRIDILKLSSTINGKPWHRYAHSYIGFGLSSEVGKKLNAADLNTKNEFVIFMKTLFRSKPFSINIQGEVVDFHNIILSNVGKMSKVLSLSKTAKVDDGKFEVFTSDSSKANMLGDIVKSATLGVPHEERASHYSFKTIEPLGVQLDGEVYKLDSDSSVEVAIEHLSLRCIV